jgi:hypothetical protein
MQASAVRWPVAARRSHWSRQDISGVATRHTVLKEMLMLKTLIAGAVLASAICTAQSAEAGHRRPCFFFWHAHGAPNQGVWYRNSAGAPNYVPAAGQPAPPPSVGPPTAQGPGQTIRRFSEEPDVTPADPTPAEIVTPPATYRPAPTTNSAKRYPYSGPPRNPVERRLRPGHGWKR